MRYVEKITLFINLKPKLYIGLKTQIRCLLFAILTVTTIRDYNIIYELIFSFA